jgi:hypothetical protein
MKALFQRFIFLALSLNCYLFSMNMDQQMFCPVQKSSTSSFVASSSKNDLKEAIDSFEKTRLSENPHVIEMDLSFLDMLLQINSQSVNQKITDQSDYPPIFYAFFKYIDQSWCYQIMQTLLKYGADPDSSIDGNLTLLHYAVRAERHDIVELLLRNGAYASPVALNKITPLHIACSLGLETIVNTLLKYNANVFLCTADGRTMLHYAIGIPLLYSGYTGFDKNGNVCLPVRKINTQLLARSRIIKTLMMRRISCCTKDKYGYNPINYTDSANGGALLGLSASILAARLFLIVNHKIPDDSLIDDLYGSQIQVDKQGTSSHSDML